MKASTKWLAVNNDQFRARGAGGCVHLSNYTAEYCEWGEGPPVVLVPGLAGGFELLGPIARLLAKEHRVISYQLRGENNCFDLRRPFDLDDLVLDLNEFLDYLCLERPSIFGVSFGGVVALEFAARHPHRLGNLIVQGVGARSERGLLQHVAGAVLSRFPLPNDNPFVNQFFNLLFGGATKRDALFDFVTQQVWQTDQSVMSHRFRLIQDFNMDDRMDRIRSRTMIVAGQRDVLVSSGSLRDLHLGIRDSQLERLPRCGHLACVTHPELIGDKVRPFLQAL